ncbi:hypothetical protein L596_015923 [Steinernema carpocapsae]|uniref:Uncharacterized protein n=1 Tax=Steinernema carpocapsae TaxID=34508 RepID=A0A4V6A390_STECR|nr:hypothetical protein L596_015923 [Steinernema carpocapsae]
MWFLMLNVLLENIMEAKVHFNEFETIIGKINCANLNLWINFSLAFFIRPEKSKRPNGPEREDVVEGIGRVNALSADELRGTLQQGHGGAIN